MPLCRRQSVRLAMTANDYESYRSAIVSTLIKEISGPPPAAPPAPPGRAMAANLKLELAVA